MLKGDKFVVGPTTIVLMKFGRNSEVNIILNQQQSLCDQSSDYSHQQICVTNNFDLKSNFGILTQSIRKRW